MSTALRALCSAALTALASLALGGCDGELSPASEIRGFRVLGARIENLTRPSDTRAAEAAPGERVRLSLAYVDASPTTRPVTFIWVFCPEAARVGATVGCSPTSATVAMGPVVEYTIPRVQYSVDPTGRARVQGVMLACAGGTLSVDRMTMLPKCEGVGAESTTMIRSIRVRTTEEDPINRNPALREVALLLAGRSPNEPVILDPTTPARMPRCAADPCPEHTIELRVADDSRETYRSLGPTGMPITQPERLLFGFFATRGRMDITFYVDTPARPMGPVRNTWRVPKEAGPVTFVFSAQDTRGGFDWVERRVMVE